MLKMIHSTQNIANIAISISMYYNVFEEDQHQEAHDIVLIKEVGT